MNNVERFEPMDAPYDKFTVSDQGYVLNCDTEEVVSKEYELLNGKPFVVLDGTHKKTRKFYLYQVVADMFVPNPNNLSYVYYKDGNQSNVSAENLGYAINPQESKQRVARPKRAEVAERRTELINEINNAIDVDNWTIAERLGIELWELEGNAWADRANQL